MKANECMVMAVSIKSAATSVVHFHWTSPSEVSSHEMLLLKFYNYTRKQFPRRYSFLPAVNDDRRIELRAGRFTNLTDEIKELVGVLRDAVVWQFVTVELGHSALTFSLRRQQEIPHIVELSPSDEGTKCCTNRNITFSIKLCWTCTVWPLLECQTMPHNATPPHLGAGEDLVWVASGSKMLPVEMLTHIPIRLLFTLQTYIALFNHNTQRSRQ